MRFPPVLPSLVAIIVTASFIHASPVLARRPGGSSQGDPLGPSSTPLARQGQRGFGGPGQMGPGEDVKLVKQFDGNGDGWLNAEERKAALAAIENGTAGGAMAMGGRGGPGGGGGRGGPGGRGPMGRGPMGGGRGGMATGSPGAHLTPADVKRYGADTPFYDTTAVRTVFLQFENAEWERELSAFHNTDVEVPATAIIDGQTYRDIGVHFRGMSSFMGVPQGLKHSLNLSMDFIHDGQQVGGYRTLNLLNSHEDATYLNSVLYYEIARNYIPAPKANYARVVINGESWGAYVSVQQFNKDFLRDFYKTTDGARWKVPGSPGARGGLEYLGEAADAYKRNYQIKSKDDPKAWADFIRLCRTLNNTPVEDLQKALEPILDLDETLRFLALDAALVNNDGYWVRSSDYSIYEDAKGKFHILPQDANETFALRGGGPGGGRGGPGGLGGPGGPGGVGDPARGGRGGDRMGGDPMFGGPGGQGGRGMMGGGVDLDPLSGLNDGTKPLRSKLLQVPALRDRYLGYVKDIARKWLDWKTLGPIAQRYHEAIAADVKADTRKLESVEGFDAGLETIKAFADQRRAFLLK